MTDHESNKRDDANDRTIVPIKAGLFLGSIAISLPIILLILLFTGFWRQVIKYNSMFFPVPFLQALAVIIIGSYIVVRSSYHQSGKAIHNERDAGITGILSGTASCVLLVISCIFFPWIVSAGNPKPVLHYFFPFTPYDLYPVIMMIVIIAGVQALIARILFKQSEKAGISENGRFFSGNRVFLSRYSMHILCILTLLVLVIPAGVTYGLMKMDTIPAFPRYDMDFHIHSAGVERSGTDTIAITLNMPDSMRGVDYGLTNPFIDPTLNKRHIIILYNSRVLSNQEVIDRQALSVKIDPPGGLEYAHNSSVILKGPGISNATSKGFLKIIDVNPSRGSADMNMVIMEKPI
jgi:hypothetical protein